MLKNTRVKRKGRHSQGPLGLRPSVGALCGGALSSLAGCGTVGDGNIPGVDPTVAGSGTTGGNGPNGGGAGVAGGTATGASGSSTVAMGIDLPGEPT